MDQSPFRDHLHATLFYSAPQNIEFCDLMGCIVIELAIIFFTFPQKQVVERIEKYNILLIRIKYNQDNCGCTILCVWLYIIYLLCCLTPVFGFDV